MDLWLEIETGSRGSVDVYVEWETDWDGTSAIYSSASYLEDPVSGELSKAIDPTVVVLDDLGRPSIWASVGGESVATNVSNPAVVTYATDSKAITREGELRIDVDDAFWRRYAFTARPSAIFHFIVAAAGPGISIFNVSASSNDVGGGVRILDADSIIVRSIDLDAVLGIQGVVHASMGGTWQGGASLARPAFWAASWTGEAQAATEIHVQDPCGASRTIGGSAPIAVGIATCAGDWVLQAPQAVSEAQGDQPMFFALGMPTLRP